MSGWGSAIGGVSGLLGSIVMRGETRRLTREQMQNEREMNAANLGLQREMWETGREDMAPWMQAGESGLNRLMALYGMGGDGSDPNEILQSDPSYQFRFGQGQKAVERGAAAKGGLFSGRAGKALTDYGQQAGSAEYGNISNRLAALAGLGQTASQTAGGYGMQYAGQAGQQMGASSGRMGNMMQNYMNQTSSFYKDIGNQVQNLIQNLDYEYGGSSR